MFIIYIGIGSNLGKRKNNCLQAIESLREKGLNIIRQSSMYETEPWGLKDQPKFINMAVEAETGLSPRKLLEVLKQIESDMGRSHTEKWGPRIIDLDILLYDDLNIAGDNLVIPHPLMHERDFVLEPLSEIAPDIVHPVLQKRIKEIFIKRRSSSEDLKILIFGVGNPLFMDDGLGNRIIEVLMEKYSLPDSIRMIEAGSMTDLIDFISDYGFIIVIDTILMGKKPGDIVTFSLDDMSMPFNSLSHSAGFLEGLKRLHERPDIFFICIEPEDISMGTGLSKTVSNKIPDIINLIMNRIACR